MCFYKANTNRRTEIKNQHWQHKGQNDVYTYSVSCTDKFIIIMITRCSERFSLEKSIVYFYPRLYNNLCSVTEVECNE